MKVKCSIIVPVYNVQDYLRPCLESIRQQTFKDFEVIIVNDGSTDDSENICLEFEKRDERYHLINKQNGGVGSARNYAMPYIHGEYTIFVDSDDVLDLHMIEYMIEIAETTKVNVVCCGYIETENVENYQKKLENVYHFDSNFCVSMLKKRYIGTAPWNKMIKTFLFYDGKNAEKYPEDLSIGEDEVWLVNVLKNEKKVAVIDLPLYFYRIRKNSATNSLKRGISEKDVDDILAQIRLYTSINDNMVELKKTIKARLTKKVMNMKIISYAFRQEKFKILAEEYKKVYKCKMHDFRCLGFKRFIVETCKYNGALLLVGLKVRPEIVKRIYLRFV